MVHVNIQNKLYGIVCGKLVTAISNDMRSNEWS